jgi:hypothetical protein
MISFEPYPIELSEQDMVLFATPEKLTSWSLHCEKVVVKDITLHKLFLRCFTDFFCNDVSSPYAAR